MCDYVISLNKFNDITHNVISSWGSWRILGDGSVTIAQWRRAQDLKNWGIRRSPVRFRPKIRQLRSIWVWVNRPWSKGSKLLIPVIKAIEVKNRCRFFISQVIVIFNVVSYHLIQNTISLQKTFTFSCHKLLTNTVNSKQCHGVLTFADSFNMPNVTVAGGIWRWFVCDEIIYYTITCSFVYTANALGKFRRGSLCKPDMSSGDLASSCRGRLSISNLQDHTPWVLDWSHQDYHWKYNKVP